MDLFESLVELWHIGKLGNLIMQKVKREAILIETEEGAIYVPRPQSMSMGMKRDFWIKSLLKKQPVIVSPGLWKQLKEQFVVKRLVEYDTGTWEVLVEKR